MAWVVTALRVRAGWVARGVAVVMEAMVAAVTAGVTSVTLTIVGADRDG
jgi:hypothetical protein